MNREEAEKLANEMLRRPVNQFYDEHYRQDNPAMRRVVQEADEFRAMLQRRGYVLVIEDGFYVVEAGNIRITVAEEFFKWQIVAEVARQIDKFVGMHHVCCIQCKEPLLHQPKRGVLCRGEIVPMTRELAQELAPVMPLGLYQEQTKDEYRSAKAGPDSPVLTVCPGCGLEFIKPMPVQEIRDDE